MTEFIVGGGLVAMGVFLGAVIASTGKSNGRNDS